MRKKQEAEQMNQMFERQQRRLNRNRLVRSLTGIALLIAAFLLLQLTPYRDVPLNILKSTLNLVTGFLSDKQANEPDAQYW